MTSNTTAVSRAAFEEWWAAFTYFDSVRDSARRYAEKAELEKAWQAALAWREKQQQESDRGTD